MASNKVQKVRDGFYGGIPAEEPPQVTAADIADVAGPVESKPETGDAIRKVFFDYSPVIQGLPIRNLIGLAEVDQCFSREVDQLFLRSEGCASVGSVGEMELGQLAGGAQRWAIVLVLRNRIPPASTRGPSRRTKVAGSGESATVILSV